MSMTPPTKLPPQRTPKRVLDIEFCENRVRDVFRQHAQEDIENNANVRMGLGIFAEYSWLVDRVRELEKELADAQPPAARKKTEAA